MLRENHTTWRCGAHEISLARPRIMGVLNVTPDSFSDGGENLDPKAAVARGLEMLDEGADIIDVGGESRRPGHTPVPSKEEAERIVPVVRALVAEGAVVSVDTRHADVARMCVRLGAAIVNDVTGFTDPEMVQVAADTDCGCIVMHWSKDSLAARPPRRQVLLDESRPTGSAAQRPVTSQRRFTLPDSAPIMRRVMGFLSDQARALIHVGVARERICIDPGAGFGKNTNEDIIIQRETAKMASLGYPLMCAVSRKRFVGAVSGVVEAADRDAATFGVCLGAIQAGANVVRVQDVAGFAQFLNGYWAVARPQPRRAFVALGSNLGRRMDNIRAAKDLIAEIPLTCVSNCSRIYESEPAYEERQEPFANAVIEIRTELAPLILLDELMKVEDKLGRNRTASAKPNGPRTLDCDLLWMEGEIHGGDKLRLPHPKLGERDFVLVPLEDLVHDPARFFRYEGVDVKEPEERVGHVTQELGTL